MAFVNSTLSEFEAKVLNAVTALPSESASADYDDVQLAGDILAVVLGYCFIISAAILWTVRTTGAIMYFPF